MAEARPPEPPVGTILETRDEIDEYRIERTRDGWALQYREGENEFGQPLANGRIPWGSAWRAWLGGGSQPVRQVQPGDPPLPPYEEEDDPYAGMGTDATNQRLDPPPAAQPWTPKGADVNEQLMTDMARGILQASVEQQKAWAERAQAANDRGDRVGRERVKREIAEYGRGQASGSSASGAGGADVNEATKGAVEGVSTVTPTGLTAAAASGVTGKDIKPPIAAATTGGGTSSGGSGMASIEEVRAGIDGAKEKASESLGALQQAQSALEEAQAQMVQVTEGSGQSDTDEANAALARAVETVTEAQQNAQVAIEAAETVVARL